MCVSCAKNLLVKFDPVNMLSSKHGGVGTHEVNHMHGSVYR